MTFEQYHGRLGVASENTIRIDKNGRIYVPASHGISGSFDLFWDAETSRIGIHPRKSGSRKFTPCRGGQIASLKGLLNEIGITYPQVCPVGMDGDFYTIKVTTNQRSS
jgi:hypothetical protein